MPPRPPGMRRIRIVAKTHSMPVPAYSKKKKKTSARLLIRRYWWLAPALGAVILLAYLATGPRWFGPRVLARTGAPIKGYISDLDTLHADYLRYIGKQLRSPQ